MDTRKKVRNFDFSAPNFGTAGAARYLDICQSLLEKDRLDGRYRIPYSRIERRIVYLRADLDVFLQKQRHVPEKTVAK